MAFCNTLPLESHPNTQNLLTRKSAAELRFNRIDIEDEQSVPYHMIVVQPFFPTTDPRVVGITPVPNIDDRIRRLTQELSASHPDTDNVQYEQADLVLDDIFKPEEDNPPPDSPSV